MRKRYYFDMDGTLCEWRYVDENDLYLKGYFLSLLPHEGIIEAAKALFDAGEDVYILSCYLPDSKYAYDEKQQWLDKYVPFVSKEKRLLVPYGTSKADFVATYFGKESISLDDVLIDDYTESLRDWTDIHGGTGIKAMNSVNGSFGTWAGARITGENAARVLKALAGAA